jgi:hypothetical protein
VNYKTGTVLDAPLGLVQGVAKGAASTGVGIGSLFRKAAGLAPLPADTFQADTEAHGAAENIGKFVEQGAEFAIPGSGVAKATKGAGLLLRAGTQAATAGGIGAAQSGGQLAPTLTSAALGGVGPLAGAGAKGIAQLAAKRAPTLANYAESFAATPKQTQKLSAALDTLESRTAFNRARISTKCRARSENRLSQLGKQYEALKASGAGSTPTDAQGVLQGLEDYAKSLKTDGVLLSGNKAKYSLVREQMRDVKRWQSRITAKSPSISSRSYGISSTRKRALLARIGKRDCTASSAISTARTWIKAVPGTAELNRSWAKYSDLAGEIEKNIAQNKGQGTSALGKMFEASEMKHTGAVIGGTLGAAVGGAPGAFVGSMAGRMILPKAAGTAGRMLENAVDAGAFQKLSPATQRVAAMAAQMGDTKALARLLGTGTAQESAQRMTRSNQ